MFGFATSLSSWSTPVQFRFESLFILQAGWYRADFHTVGRPVRFQGLQLAGIEAAHLLAFSLVDEQDCKVDGDGTSLMRAVANQQNTSTKAISPTPDNYAMESDISGVFSKLGYNR